MTLTPTEEDLVHLRSDHVLEDPYFIVTRYRNLPFIVVQSLFTEKYYKLSEDGKYLEPKSTRSSKSTTTHGTLDIMEILS